MNIKVFKVVIAILAVVILALGGLLVAQKTGINEKKEPLPDIATSVFVQQRKATVKEGSARE
ncbi:hypothetical protein LI142_19410 [Eubacterium limosum]|uniref:Efflux transporter periplasmic adaptor subunit n=1 Tax=Eubacterium limosum TaxID=1736 RepID=A0ABT5UNY9_EUBLI|nr:hypothetical protein [Eubacterium limosum]MCB6571670.1 hypothetical protein [Eubacterium limosum]MDE1470638.1 hypothetical protein [Eubacterium limosum]